MLGRTHLTNDEKITLCKRKINKNWSYDSDNYLEDADCKQCVKRGNNDE